MKQQKCSSEDPSVWGADRTVSGTSVLGGTSPLWNDLAVTYKAKCHQGQATLPLVQRLCRVTPLGSNFSVTCSSAGWQEVSQLAGLLCGLQVLGALTDPS